jgi:hypothetical protein
MKIEWRTRLMFRPLFFSGSLFFSHNSDWLPPSKPQENPPEAKAPAISGLGASALIEGEII